jgi:hypothetical protein
VCFEEVEVLHDFNTELLVPRERARVHDWALNLTASRSERGRVVRARRWAGIGLVRIGLAIARGR